MMMIHHHHYFPPHRHPHDNHHHHHFFTVPSSFPAPTCKNTANAVKEQDFTINIIIVITITININIIIVISKKTDRYGKCMNLLHDLVFEREKKILIFSLVRDSKGNICYIISLPDQIHLQIFYHKVYSLIKWAKYLHLSLLKENLFVYIRPNTLKTLHAQYKCSFIKVQFTEDIHSDIQVFIAPPFP